MSQKSAVSVTPVLAEDTGTVRSFMERVIVARLNVTLEVQAATIANVNQNVDIWLERPESCVHLKAIDEGALVGVILVKEFWNLCSLFVDPTVHRRGIGTSLVEAAAELCDGKSAKNALVLNAAPNAVSFYQHLGFVRRQSQQGLPQGFVPMHRLLGDAGLSRVGQHSD